ncbi:MAG: hypothetical protein Ct9H90mV1_0360 [Prasinovirus sp.]|nr:MAG: hypothetical protein Ct9H90mV1_0360 [Prasinovirus sp.]
MTGNKLKTLPKEIAKINFERINVTNNPNIRIPYILKNKSIDGGFYDEWHILRSPNNIKYNYTNYYKNQLEVINKKRNNLPSLPRNIKNKIAKQVSNVEPVTKPKPPSKTKNPFRKLVRRIKKGTKAKQESKLKRNEENIKKVTNRIKNSIKTPKKPNTQTRQIHQTRSEKRRVTPLRVDVLTETNHFLYTNLNLLYKSETGFPLRSSHSVKVNPKSSMRVNNMSLCAIGSTLGPSA